jgi:hypothetical protein
VEGCTEIEGVAFTVKEEDKLAFPVFAGEVEVTVIVCDPPLVVDGTVIDCVIVAEAGFAFAGAVDEENVIGVAEPEITTEYTVVVVYLVVAPPLLPFVAVKETVTFDPAQTGAPVTVTFVIVCAETSVKDRSAPMKRIPNISTRRALTVCNKNAGKIEIGEE